MHYMQSPQGEIFTTQFPQFHKECTELSKRQGAQALKEQSKKQLLELLAPGQTVYTVLRKSSASGMSRVISLYVICEGRDNQPAWPRLIDSLVAEAMSWRLDKHGVRVSGCGMDMGFHLVYSLAQALWAEGVVLDGKKTSPGYLLKQSWL